MNEAGGAKGRRPFVMQYALSPQVHAVHVRDDLVILDVAADAYYCIAAAAPSVALSSDRRIVAGPAAQLDELLRAGLVEAAPPASSPTFAPPPLDENLRRVWRDRARVTAADVFLALATGLRARQDLRRLGFAGLIRQARDEPVRHGTRSLAASCGTFEAVRPWIPFDGDCLFRSYWQLLFLRALGHGEIQWVFGVRTWPFFAHCWLQAGDQVLNDDPDILVGYRQIMAV